MKKTGSIALWKTSGGIAGLLIILAILVAVNVILSNVTVRTDLTEERLFTLSEGTRKVLDSLDRDVTLKLFFNSSSPDVPIFLKNYARQLEDLLREYRMLGDGRISVEKYDPKPDSDAEEWAQRYGLSGQPMDMFGSAVYLGLVAVAGDSEAVIPIFDPRTEDLMEYTITRLIARVSDPEKPVVGVLSSLPVLGSTPPPFAMPGQPRPQPRPAWLSFQDLGEDYDVRQLELELTEIAADIDALVVVHPKEWSEQTLYAIDQFLLRGGRLLVFLDPLSIADLESAAAAPNPYQMNLGASDLGPLLTAWGVRYEPDRVVADLKAASRIRAANNQIEDSPIWLSLIDQNLNDDDTLTTQLESLMLPFAGAFADETGDGVTFAPLATSSENACTVHARSAQFGGQALRGEIKSGGVPLHLAVRLTGTFTTAFPAGPPQAEPGQEAEGVEDGAADDATQGLTEGASTVILVGDVDMLHNRFCIEELDFFGSKGYRPLNDNLTFFANALEQISGSANLIGIRSRGKTTRPFTRVLALQQKARLEWQSREDDLVRKLEEAQRRLAQLQSQKDQSQRFILSKEQRDAIESFQAEESKIKQELKGVRKSLSRDIETLGVKVKLLNVALVPLLIVLAGIAYGVYRRRKH